MQLRTKNASKDTYRQTKANTYQKRQQDIQIETNRTIMLKYIKANSHNFSLKQRAVAEPNATDSLPAWIHLVQPVRVWRPGVSCNVTVQDVAVTLSAITSVQPQRLAQLCNISHLSCVFSGTMGPIRLSSNENKVNLRVGRVRRSAAVYFLGPRLECNRCKARRRLYFADCLLARRFRRKSRVNVRALRKREGELAPGLLKAE